MKKQKERASVSVFKFNFQGLLILFASLLIGGFIGSKVGGDDLSMLWGSLIGIIVGTILAILNLYRLEKVKK